MTQEIFKDYKQKDKRSKRHRKERLEEREIESLIKRSVVDTGQTRFREHNRSNFKQAFMRKGNRCVNDELRQTFIERCRQKIKAIQEEQKEEERGEFSIVEWEKIFLFFEEMDFT